MVAPRVPARCSVYDNRRMLSLCPPNTFHSTTVFSISSRQIILTVMRGIRRIHLTSFTSVKSIVDPDSKAGPNEEPDHVKHNQPPIERRSEERRVGKECR